MSNPEVSQSCEIPPHSHSTIDGNLTLSGTKNERVKDGLGIVAGFKEVKVYRCRICAREIEKVNPEIFPPGEYDA